MVKKGLIMILVAYFFIVQAFIAWMIWQDSHFYTLWCVNLLFFVLFFFWVNVFKWSDWEKKQEKNVSYPIVKEKIEHEKIVEPVEQSEVTEPVVEEKAEWVDSFRRVRSDQQISESNIEYIKTKINRAKRKPLREWSSIYRFLVFLLAILWLWGILYVFRDSLDFIGLAIWALAMLIFIWVCFKTANLWRKSLFSSMYFLIFFVLMLMWVYWMIFTNNSWTEKLKESISTFFYGVKWDESLLTWNVDEDTWYVFESTGSVISFSLSWDSIYDSWSTLSWEQKSWGVITETTGLNLESQTIVEEPKEEQTKPEQPVAEQPVAKQPVVQEKVESQNNNSTSQVTIIEAIKHLVSAYNIPLSKSTSSKFTHVSKSSSMYPYMKTALEKRMIWTTTDPQMIVSCDVYMVMKWIAEWWNIAKSANLKENYWNVAESKWLLNWCVKWEKLTYANL